MSMYTPHFSPFSIPAGLENHDPSIFAAITAPTVRPVSVEAGSENEGDPENGTNLFGKLVSLVKEHDDLVAELAVLRVKINRAASYLEIEGSHAKLGQANLDRLKTKHSSLLSRLRVNRLEARRFLQRLDSETPSN